MSPKSLGMLAALAAFMLATSGVALAGDAASAKSSELSPAALGADTIKSSQADANKPDLKIPNSIKFGDRTLSLDTDRKSVDSSPRVGVDAQPQVLNQHTDDDPLKPGYFGLKLSMPTH
jgi:hypothetical protein